MNSQPVVLIIGANGFLGANISSQLARFGFRVRGIDLAFDRLFGLEGFDNVRDYPFEFKIQDFISMPLNDEFFEGVDSLVICAGNPAPQLAEHNPTQVGVTDIGILLKSIEVVKNNFIRKLIVFSSAAVYGTSDRCVSETESLSPANFYGTVWAIREKILEYWIRKMECQVTCFRLFNGYGREGEKSSVASLFCQKVAADQLPLCLTGNVHGLRSFVHVDDIAHAIKLAIEKPYVQGTFNLGSRQLHSIIDLVDLLDVSWVDGGIDETGLDGRPRPNLSKIESELGWEPQVKLSKGLQRTVEYYREVRQKRF